MGDNVQVWSKSTRATQSKTAVGAPLVTKDAHHLLCTGVLAVLQGRFEEGMENLLKIVPGEEQTHLSGKKRCFSY